jgi:two-component system NtrC family sensor kinase
VMMPEMSGLDLCGEIKRDPDLAGIPVVLVTSKAESEMRTEGLEQGADDYVTKPFHPRELLARVRSLVAKRHLQLQLAERNQALEVALKEIRDTEVKLVQAERLSAVGELAAGVAHEINNPVNFALNAARTLDGCVKELVAAHREAEAETENAATEAEPEVEELSDTIEELVGIVRQGLDRTQDIVAKLRDFSAPSRGIESLVDVSIGIRATGDLLRYYLNERESKLTLQLPEALPPILGDAGALNQVFLNLIKNAAEAMTGTGGEIFVEATVEEDFLEIQFRDEGPGIPEEVHAHLFEPFYTSKREGEGTGLGLSVCRQIAESHGGQLELISGAGESGIFRLKLPLMGSDQSRDAT